MKVVVQRSKYSKVVVDNKLINEITEGMVLLVSFTQTDTIDTLKKMANKIANLRIFDDESGVMNKSIIDKNLEILSISQFTLYADTKKGNRPSYIKALNGHDAKILYDQFNDMLNSYVPVKSGIFGADMKLYIQNDGPVTILLEY